VGGISSGISSRRPEGGLGWEKIHTGGVVGGREKVPTGSGERREIAHPNLLKRNNTPWSIQRGESL